MRYLCMMMGAVLSVLLGLVGTPQAAEVSAVLSWQANAEADLAGYKVYRSTTSGVYGAPVATLGKATAHTLLLPQLTVDTTYFFTVTAYDTGGNESPKAAEVSKRIPAAPIIETPGVPVLLLAITSATSATVSWPDVPDGMTGAAAVDLRYAANHIVWGSAVSAVCPASPCTLTGLTPGTPYEFQAVAYRGTPNVDAVFGALSGVARGTTPDPPPAPVQGLTITKADVNEIIITALVADCPKVTTSTKGSTAVHLKRTVKCARS